VFTRSGSTWTQQAKLTGSGETGEGGFGTSVALSSDGDTALIGGPRDYYDYGSAWAFTRTGSTWAQQGPKLGRCCEFLEFGKRVALSSDGDLAVIEAPAGIHGYSALWVFTRTGSTWDEHPEMLVGTELFYASSVALSPDGNTALIGDSGKNGNIGAARVFNRAGSTWTQQKPDFTGTGETGAGQFGDSVALSSDGTTALIGGPWDNSGYGAVWAFAGTSEPGEPISGGGGVPQVQTLPASDVTTTGATLHGSVNPNGAALSDCHFDLGTTTGYGRTVGCDPSSVGAGSAPVAISALIGVDPGATYHYRLVATNANGTADGEDQTFTTSGTQSPDPSGAWGLIVSSAPGSSEMDAALTIGGWNPAAGAFTGSGHQLAVISGRHLIPAHGAINLAGRFVQHLATYSCSILLPCVYLALDLPDSTLLTLSGSSSCLPPFSMCWTGTGTDNHGFKYSWYACKGCAGSLPSQVIKRFSQSVAKSDQECSDFLGAAGDSGAGTLGPWGEVVNWVSTALSFLCDAGSGDAAAIAADPPDSRYGSIVSPEFGKPLRVPRGVPRRQQRLLQKWIDEEREDAALRHALRVSLERAEGATEAGDGKWTLRQMIAVSEFARQDASALYEEAHTLVKLRRALAATGAVNPLITANEVRRAQNHLKRHGFRPAMRRLLIRAGANQSQLTDLRAQIVQASPRKLRGRVFSRFTSPAYIGRLTTFADQLKEYAVTVAEHPLG
jgi:phage gpG-like protein